MPERSRKKKPRDLNQLAAAIAREATEPTLPEDPTEDAQKNPAAVELGRLGGKKGGPARAKKLSAKKRSEIARKGRESTMGAPSSSKLNLHG